MGPYTRVRHIGSGSFGSVSLVQAQNGATYALRACGTTRDMAVHDA